MVDENYNVKIIDFGCAEYISPEYSTQRDFKGSASWASPEIVKGKHYREKNAEIWQFLFCYSSEKFFFDGFLRTLGYLLYTILFGLYPFVKPSAIVHEDYKLPHNINSCKCFLQCAV